MLLCFAIGHSFRRTSTTTLADAGASTNQIKRHGGWKSTSSAERYVAESNFQKRNSKKMITSMINIPSKSDLSAPIPQLDKPASFRKFTFKTPKFCTIPQSSFPVNNLSTSYIDVQFQDVDEIKSSQSEDTEEMDIRLSQYIVEDYIL